MSNFKIQRLEVSEAIKSYYLIYAIKTITDRSLPDVRDGFKPVHRRILWKMYAIGLLNAKEMAKSSTVVTETMKIHGHGDGSVYNAMAKLTDQQEGLLHPYVEGEGAFGKQYLTDKPTPFRYTFAKLLPFSEELFKDIDKNIVKIIGEDKDHYQPLVLAPTFPNILIKNNEGIAVGMKCYIPSFNLIEVCKGTIAYINDENVNMMDYIKCPDFSSGGQIIHDENELKKIINHGKGRIKIRSKYRYDSENNLIEVYEIPHNTTANAIIDEVSALIGTDKFKQINDIREETGFNRETGRTELTIAIEVKRNTDVDKLMAMLFSCTSFEKNINVNMNCLVDYKPMVLGVKDILKYWLKFRKECVSKALEYDIAKLEKELHFLKGYEKVLLDIDKAIEIIRFSKKVDVISKLSSYFAIDEIQAKSITKIELGNINEEYILKEIKVIKSLEDKIKDLRSKVSNEEEINKIIIKQLQEVMDKYGIPRKTEILYDVPEVTVTEEIENYKAMFFVTKEGYIKKIPSLNLMRSSKEQMLKDGDIITAIYEGDNLSNILCFSDKGNCYKLKASNLKDGKVSVLGEYVANLVGTEKDENIISIVVTNDYNGKMLFAFENGKIAKVSLDSYETKTNRSKLINAYNDKSKIVSITYIDDEIDLLLKSNTGGIIVIDSDYIDLKATRTTQGNLVMKTTATSKLELCVPVSKVEGIKDIEYYRLSYLGTLGTKLKTNDKIILNEGV